MTTAELLDRVTYPRNKIYAPCWGANHDHSRAIATCDQCGRDVVIYKGRLLNVRENERGARKFTCWAEAHSCVDAKSPDAQALSNAYYAAKAELDAFREQAFATAESMTLEERMACFEKITDLVGECQKAQAAANDAGLTWIGWV